ncbi:hypothetical protein [Roseimicrobium sp. ORNL1]|jgi:hypothetical protein|uniref:hypothetical protein n=1 Tax=Roseimicrobium sp. ORNL1 TaxID=2711231 RepID=UPI0013E0EC64|nr:hypothetical protein [Roseimicrobium sp. ORNL1]QIF00397.1 hypothetical protein G5S37_02260 [Roseimicrobium sp. ORNL1]
MMRVPQPGCWYRFTPADWQFIGDILALSERNRESLAKLGDDPDAVRSIADEPRLFEALLMSQRAALVSPELFFFVVVRQTLKRIGVQDLEVADYMAVVCADFGVPTNPAADREQEKASLYSVDYLQALESAGSHERFFIHVQCANQFLVLTCLYPSFLHHRAERKGAPDVKFYDGVVMNHLSAAGRHILASEFALHDVLMKLSEAFPPVRRAMNYTLREYLHLGA